VRVHRTQRCWHRTERLAHRAGALQIGSTPAVIAAGAVDQSSASVISRPPSIVAARL
jgi:hypothetical protein